MTIKHHTWPNGCSHPNSCERHNQCSYTNCRYEFVDIRPAILQLQKYRAEIERNQKQATTLKPAALLAPTSPTIQAIPAMGLAIETLYAFAKEGVSIGNVDPMETLSKIAILFGIEDGDVDELLARYGLES